MTPFYRFALNKNGQMEPKEYSTMAMQKDISERTKYEKLWENETQECSIDGEI